MHAETADFSFPVWALPCHSLAAHTQVSMALDAARGLQAMHEAPGGAIVHFDIKPQQMMIDETGMVKINDLNMCRFAPTDANGNTCSFPSRASNPGGCGWVLFFRRRRCLWPFLVWFCCLMERNNPVPWKPFCFTSLGLVSHYIIVLLDMGSISLWAVIATVFRNF